MDDLFTNADVPKEAPKAMGVSELSKRIHAVLDGSIGRVVVIGQINNPKLGHHWYFTLADEDSKIDCAMWASRVKANTLNGGETTGENVRDRGWKPQQGDQVIITGTVGHYAKFGKTQIYVEQINPVGQEKGALQQQFDALVKELREVGWFDTARKKPLPKYPRTIAVITSATSAAVQDVIETARRRWAAVKLLIINVPVQGDAAASAIIDAIQRVDQSAKRMGVDAIIVTRGGGSLEELWSFNERGVVEAAFHCNTPIVVAIGHESDTTIIELVADHRASTPTQAVMVLIPDAQELEQMINHYAVRLRSVVQRTIERSAARMQYISSSLAASLATGLHGKHARLAVLVEALTARRPHALMQMRQKRILTLTSNLQMTMQRMMTQRAHTVDTQASRLDAIDPVKVLGRGFTLTQDASGNIIRSATAVQVGQQITTVLADGTIKSTVECAS